MSRAPAVCVLKPPNPRRPGEGSSSPSSAAWLACARYLRCRLLGAGTAGGRPAGLHGLQTSESSQDADQHDGHRHGEKK